jgi:hypothetical protein
MIRKRGNECYFVVTGYTTDNQRKLDLVLGPWKGKGERLTIRALRLGLVRVGFKSLKISLVTESV